MSDPYTAADLRPMTPTQERTFTDLLAVGGPRPYEPPGLVAELREHLERGTGPAVERWSERSLWLSKGQLFAALRCEQQFRTERETPRSEGKHPLTAAGDVTHRAIQLAYTHPGRPVAEYVRYAIASLRGSEADFEVFFSRTDMATQSDVVMAATSRVTAFLDSWPTMADEWSPRFEEPIQAKVGGLTLSARVDLVLGRPRTTGQQTMFIADWKSGALGETHADEAMFYALVAALRHGVAPYRSCVYSLASGTYTDPDVTAERLWRAADQVIAGVAAIVEVLTDRREPTRSAGRHCSYCPLKDDCSAYAELAATAGCDALSGPAPGPGAAATPAA
jgi:hypothetical protein